MKFYYVLVCALILFSCSGRPAHAIVYSLVTDPLTPYQRKAFVSDLASYAAPYANGVSYPSSLNSVGSAYRPTAFAPKTGSLSAVTNIGVNGITRRGALVIKKLAPAIPYVGLALGVYSLYSDIRDALNADPTSATTSPKLTSALNKPFAYPALTANSTDLPSTVIGSYVTIDGYNRRLVDYQWIPNNGCSTVCSNPSSTQIGVSPMNFENGVYTVGRQQVFQQHDFMSGLSLWTYDTNAPPAPVGDTMAKSDTEVATSLSSYNALNDPSYLAELDKLFRETPGMTPYSAELSPKKTEISGDLDTADLAYQRELATVAARDAAAATKAALFSAYQHAESSAGQAAMNWSVAQGILDAARTAKNNLPGNATPAEIAAADKVIASAGVALSASIVASGVADVSKANTYANYLSVTSTQTKEDALIPPSVPSNTYDPTITPPDKKNITSLLGTFISSSPLVAMVRTFTITASGVGVVPIGTVYGKEMAFDFTHWEPMLRVCGGVLLIIVHGFAVFVVVRGW